MRSRVFVSTLFGTIGGVIGFLLQEFLVHHYVNMAASQMLKVGALFGCMLGVGLGVVEGILTGNPRTLVRGGLIGFVIGLIGGVIGAQIGGIAYNIALMGKDQLALENSSNLFDFLHAVIARSLGWTFLGAIPGLAAGASTLSFKRMMHGLTGGLIGGFLGGMLFLLVAKSIGTSFVNVTAGLTGANGTVEVGGPSRAVGFVGIGLFVGLFVGLVEELMKQAWVRVLAGKNEGRDFILSKPLTVLGRDERADVPIFGDPGLAPQHAAIRMENGRHQLLDGGSQLGSVVNGQRVGQPVLLKDGDMIQMGQVRLLFREKATAQRVGIGRKDLSKTSRTPVSDVSMPGHLCPYCGAPKDGAGNCRCTVTGGTPGIGTMPPAYGGQPTGGFSSATTPINSGYGDPNAGIPMGGGYAGGYDPGYGGQSFGNTPVSMQDPYPMSAGSMGPGSRLIAIEGPMAGSVFSLQPGVTTIGRKPENQISLGLETTVSGRHARIVEENGGYTLYDDGSTNGTFVNRVRVTIQPLVPGDEIQFGAARFRFE